MCLWFHSRTVVVWGSQSMLSTQKILADCIIACNVVFSIDVLVDAMLSFISLEFIICHGGTLSLTLHICLLGLEATTFYLVCCHHYNNKWFVDTIWYIYTYIIDLNPFVPLQLKINAIVVHVYTKTQFEVTKCAQFSSRFLDLNTLFAKYITVTLNTYSMF